MTTETEQTTEGAEPERKGGNEAARYRVRAKQAEQDRDALAARVVRLQTSEVHRLAAARMADPDDLTVHGVQVVDLLDTDGEVDAALVEAAVDALLTKRPRLAADYEPDAEGLDGGARKSAPGSTASWGSLLSGREARR
jgi:hypothetical protein